MGWDTDLATVRGVGSGGVIISGVFTADTTGVTKNDVCFISAANKLKPVTSLTAQAVAGIAMNTAASTAAVDLLVVGLATLTADGTVAGGDVIGPASTTGRAVTLNSTTPAGTNSAPAFTGNAVASGGPSSTASVGSSAHTHTPTQRNAACVATCNCASGAGLTGTASINPTGGPSATTTVGDSAHTHTTAATGTVAAPAFTGTAVQHGRAFGRALTAATVGTTFTAYVFCGGGL